MSIKQFIKQIANGKYEPFRKYLRTGENGSPVKMLDLTYKIRDMNNRAAFIKHLFEAIKPITTLTELKLYNNRINNDDAVTIAEMLKTNETLIKLTIARNEIGPDGATAIAEMLKINATLTMLDLSINEIGVGATEIGEALKTNTALTELYLRMNFINDEGAAAIGKALKTNEKLANLDLYYNKISLNGFAAIAKALKKNVTLVRLNLGQNLLEENNIVSILRMIPLSALTHLDFEADVMRYHSLIKDITASRKKEKDNLDAIYDVLPQTITEEIAQYYTEIQNIKVQNLLIEPNNDISKGLTYVRDKRYKNERAKQNKRLEQVPSIQAETPSTSEQEALEKNSVDSKKRNLEQDNTSKRQRNRRSKSVYLRWDYFS